MKDNKLEKDLEKLAISSFRYKQLELINKISKLDPNKDEDARMLYALNGVSHHDFDRLVANLGSEFEVEDLEDAARSYLREQYHRNDE